MTESSKSVNFSGQRDSGPFKDSRIVDQRILKVVVMPDLIEIIQVRDDGLGIPCPKDDRINVGWLKADSIDPIWSEGVTNMEKPIPDPVHKPYRIESRNIRSSAGTDDHIGLIGEGKDGNLT